MSKIRRLVLFNANERLLDVAVALAIDVKFRDSEISVGSDREETEKVIQQFVGARISPALLAWNDLDFVCSMVNLGLVKPKRAGLSITDSHRNLDIHLLLNIGVPKKSIFINSDEAVSQYFINMAKIMSSK